MEANFKSNDIGEGKVVGNTHYKKVVRYLRYTCNSRPYICHGVGMVRIFKHIIKVSWGHVNLVYCCFQHFFDFPSPKFGLMEKECRLLLLIKASDVRESYLTEEFVIISI